MAGKARGVGSEGESSATKLERGGEEPADRFPIVGIGASAGGLAAFEAFFCAMPADTESGMAFVLVQHLAPDHKSLLTDLIRRYTRMQVFEVEDGMKVQPDCAYIIPPNRDMTFVKGSLHLLAPAAPRGQRLPIDFFFRSLAQDQGERAICIVLSGTGSDGTLGLRAVKGEGGMVMAQNPESTEYDGMPRSAIGTGLVDYVLPPAEMPHQLIAYAALAFGQHRRPTAPPSRKAEDELETVFDLLRTQTGHDFSQYKPNTILRRVERRMAIQQLEHFGDYVSYLQKTPSEIDALFRDLLIGVTSFFRDPEAFQALEIQVIPAVLADKRADSVIRVWVPGCSTGEEAYSIAILLREKLEALKQNVKVQVFATDIDARAIQTARASIYPASIAADIAPERLTRHFSQMPDGNYCVHKSVRELLVFSEQDVTKDPPFSKLDLVSCRNLMIYMGTELQKRLIPLFHYALKPGGALFLGTSETVGDFGQLFSTTDRKAKLYRRKEGLADAARLSLGNVRALKEAGNLREAGHTLPEESKPSHRELIERSLLEDAPVAALINEAGDLLYLHGRTGQYLEPAPGEVVTNILKMTREGLRKDLTNALHKAVSGKERVFRPGLQVKSGSDADFVDLTIRPVSAGIQAGGPPDLFVVTFQSAPPRPASANHDGTSGTAEEPRIVALLEELQTKDAYLDTVQERMQTQNEELKSSNEELQSTNEELQSANEELETSKEELQSVNEELATVNAELQSKVSDLSRVNNDMNNLLAGTGIGTVFVDHQLQIRRFTPAITQFINLIQTDVGRPLGHIVSNLAGYDGLVADVQGVLNTLTPADVQVQTHAGARFLLRISPYRTSENVVEGAVITFTEGTTSKSAAPAESGAAASAHRPVSGARRLAGKPLA